MTDMTPTKIAVLDDYQSVAAVSADWGTLGYDVSFFDRHLDDYRQVAEQLDGFEVVVAMRERTPFDRQLLASLPGLKLLVTTGMRNVAIDIEAASELGVTVCGTRSPGHATAELAFAFVQTLARGLISEADSVATGGWQVGLGRDLRDARLGVIGLGRLGAQVARFGLAFGMDVRSWSENLTDERAQEVGVRLVSKRELLESADFVTIHLRLSDRTRGLIGPEELSVMRQDAYLINTSRGEIVDEDALVRAVRAQTIAGAALDVYSQEPLPPDHPFRAEPRIVATPHIGYVTKETYRIFFGDAVEDIAAWAAGSPVRVLG